MKKEIRFVCDNNTLTRIVSLIKRDKLQALVYQNILYHELNRVCDQLEVERITKFGDSDSEENDSVNS